MARHGSRGGAERWCDRGRSGEAEVVGQRQRWIEAGAAWPKGGEWWWASGRGCETVGERKGGGVKTLRVRWSVLAVKQRRDSVVDWGDMRN